MKTGYCLMGIMVAALAGCATPDDGHLKMLEDQLARSRDQVEAFDKENRRINEEVELFRKAQNVDRDQLFAARDAFVNNFKGEIQDQSLAVAVTVRGLVLVISAEKLFVSGSDALSPEGKTLLDRVAPVIDMTLPGYYVYIEGHTDNQPLAVFEWKSDWEFSFARALSVLKYFAEVKKMDPLRFSAGGFGQYRPRATNETKEGRSLNRRIELIILPQRGPASVEPPVEELPALPAEGPAPTETS